MPDDPVVEPLDEQDQTPAGDGVAGTVVSLLSIVVALAGLGAFYVAAGLTPPWREAVFALGGAFLPAGLLMLLFHVYLTTTILSRTETILGGVARRMARGLRQAVVDTTEKSLVDTRGIVESHMKRIEALINSVECAVPLLPKAQEMGLCMIHEDRNTALHSFREHIADERRGNDIYFVGSSLLGLLKVAGGDFAALLREKREAGCKLYFLLTHPGYSGPREIQEGRTPEQISREIWNAVDKIREIGVPAESIKFYRGSPTCFAIMTPQRMLLNPYPYEREAYSCFCIEVTSDARGRAIYEQYRDAHVVKPWQGGNAVPLIQLQVHEAYQKANKDVKVSAWAYWFQGIATRTLRAYAFMATGDERPVYLHGVSTDEEYGEWKSRLDDFLTTIQKERAELVTGEDLRIVSDMQVVLVPLHGIGVQPGSPRDLRSNLKLSFDPPSVTVWRVP